jgi:hypothetical protein
VDAGVVVDSEYGAITENVQYLRIAVDASTYGWVPLTGSDGEALFVRYSGAVESESESESDSDSASEEEMERGSNTEREARTYTCSH